MLYNLYNLRPCLSPQDFFLSVPHVGRREKVGFCGAQGLYPHDCLYLSLAPQGFASVLQDCLYLFLAPQGFRPSPAGLSLPISSPTGLSPQSCRTYCLYLSLAPQLGFRLSPAGLSLPSSSPIGLSFQSRRTVFTYLWPRRAFASVLQDCLYLSLAPQGFRLSPTGLSLPISSPAGLLSQSCRTVFTYL